ncbi:MAG TPA: tetratricopeptide repeat protein, partial [Stellaceae bacterium]|nr:tetratricopeptide repeat protein [Stellaceae bacterium]
GKTISLDPHESEGFTMRCLVRAIVGKLQEALADCNQAIKLNPNDVEAYSNRGLVYLKLKQPAVALANYHQALQQNPGGDTLLYGQGIAKHMLGDQSGGDADIAEAKKLSPDIATVFAKWGVSER